MTDTPSGPSNRPFRFGVQARQAGSAAAWRDLALRCEDLGYSVLTMPDHFDDSLAPMPALSIAAAHTTTLRVGALVFDNDYKHPVVLAKELATLDLLSDGRLEIGLGAGWMETDYLASGIPYDAPGVRVDRFEEGLAIIRQAMTGEAFHHTGRHYTITDYRGAPLPAQQPCPPILIGGGGKRVLGIAARNADIVGINATMHAGRIGPEAIATMTAEAVDAKIEIVRRAAGARWNHVELNVRSFLVNVTDQRDSARDAIAGMMGVDRQMVADTPFALVGNASQLVDDLQARRDRWGFSYVIVGAEDVDAFAPVVAALSGR